MCTNDLAGSLPSNVESLLQDFDVGDDLRANHLQEGENDANKAAHPSIHDGEVTGGLGGTQGQRPRDPLGLLIGPITRLRAKRFKEVLNGLIQEVWTQVNSWRPNELGPRYHQRSITMIGVLEESGQKRA